MYELHNDNKTEKKSPFFYRSRIGHGLDSFMYTACVGSYILVMCYIFIVN